MRRFSFIYYSIGSYKYIQIMKHSHHKPSNYDSVLKDKYQSEQPSKSLSRNKQINSRNQPQQQKQQPNLKNTLQKPQKIQKQQKALTKVNSIVSIISKQYSKNDKRPNSEEKKKQPKQIEKQIINKNAPSKSIADVKELQDSKPMSHTKDIKQKDIGLIWMNPQHDTLFFQDLQTTDPVYQKYFDMILNDSDTIFVMNAVPEIKPFKTEPSQNKIDFFLSNKMSRISGQFNQLTPQKVISILKAKPSYLDSKSKVINEKLTLSTKWKVVIDVGFSQHLVQNNRIVISRVYLSRIYRRMNYLGYLYMRILLTLLQKYQSIDKISIFLHDRNLGSIKFFKFIGGKIQRIFTDSSHQKVDYYQEFVCKRKDVLKAAEIFQM